MTAARNAWAEVESLRREARSALEFANTTAGLAIAQDACQAYARAYDRAVDAQHLADQWAGEYNVWAGDAP